MNYLAALLSVFIVGLGQIIMGKSKKGVRLLLAFYFALPALLYSSLLLGNSFFLYVLSFCLISGTILWLYSIGDALRK